MQVTEKLTKALTEAKYLNADNVSQYTLHYAAFFLKIMRNYTIGSIRRRSTIR